ncbi:kinase [Erysipelothrix sp. HDW6C]|uniref:AAA family ATPase n=1 Tax=Erysipelothrix sp. HDW6C TaxID=2714930 RepID=UPI001409AF54|nr:AAA family ATPase [Erysipelothrix sp. HDW6C]QIK69474.1 kinase [Erysipelothrix sp. HDW6C]
MATLIILRGNSGSGKTTVAKQLQHEISGAMRISQDEVRRDVLGVGDGQGNLSVNLMEKMAQYGSEHCPVVIVEGILKTWVYRDMLETMISFFDTTISVYFKVSFAETVVRHQTKPNCDDFGEAELISWWNEDDRLGYDDELEIDDAMTLSESVKMILKRYKEIR